MIVNFIKWLENNYPTEVVQNYIQTYKISGNMDLNDLTNEEPSEFLNYAFTWSQSDLPDTLWQSIDEHWRNYLNIIDRFELPIIFGEIKKVKYKEKINIKFDI
jgi:hypothetical protein